MIEQDEWVVCRVFQKSVGGKKFPSSNQSRATMNHYNNLDNITSTTAINNVSSQMMMQADAGFQYNMGRNYISPAEMQELSRVFSRNAASNMNLQLQSQINYAAGTGFTLSGLNLNLSGSTATTTAPPSIINHQDVPVLTNALINPHDAAAYVTAEMNNSTSMGNRFVAMDNCDMDNYWQPY